MGKCFLSILAFSIVFTGSAARAAVVETGALPGIGASKAPISPVPAWFDASRLSVIHSKSSDGECLAVLRYGLIRTYTLVVSANLNTPHRDSMLFVAHSLNPMGEPKHSKDVPLLSAHSRRTAVDVLRGAAGRDSLNAEQKAALDELIAVLEGRP